MSMTQEEAVRQLRDLRDHCRSMVSGDNDYPEWASDVEALDMAIASLEEDSPEACNAKLWHDAKTDPPRLPGLYYAKVTGYLYMYPCRYWGGVWTFYHDYDSYLDYSRPGKQEQIDVVKWADYDRFSRCDEAYALPPISKSPEEAVWKGEWIDHYIIRYETKDLKKCNRCGALAIDHRLFCPHCGAAMTDEAMELVLKRLKAVK